MEWKIEKTPIFAEEVKKALKIINIGNLSKDEIIEFVLLTPNMDREVAIKIVEQYPTIAKS